MFHYTPSVSDYKENTTREFFNRFSILTGNKCPHPKLNATVIQHMLIFKRGDVPKPGRSGTDVEIRFISVVAIAGHVYICLLLLKYHAAHRHSGSKLLPSSICPGRGDLRFFTPRQRRDIQTGIGGLGGLHYIFYTISLRPCLMYLAFSLKNIYLC